MGFDLYNTGKQYLKAEFALLDLALSIETKENRHILYNSHFKKSQTYFNLGLDFFLYSFTFLDITPEE